MTKRSLLSLIPFSVHPTPLKHLRVQTKRTETFRTSSRLIKGLFLVLLGKQEAAYESLFFLMRWDGKHRASGAPKAAREAVNNKEEPGCDLSHVLMLPGQVSSCFFPLSRGR